MKNSIVQILIFISLIYITIFFAFRSDSYCASSALIGQTLWNSYNIASEYYAARAGRNIVNASEVSTDLSGIGGINNGVASSDYSKIFSNNFNISVDYIMDHVNDVDISELSLSDQAKLAQIMAANNNVPYAYKCFTLGGISLYFAVNDLGEWIGNSYDNIVAKFESMTSSKAQEVIDQADTLYPSEYIYYGKDFGFSYVVNNVAWNYQAHFSTDVFLYCDPNVSANGNHLVSIMFDESNWPTISGVQIVNGQTYNITSFGPGNSGRYEYNGITYRRGILSISSTYWTNNNIYSPYNFGTFDDVLALIDSITLNGGYSYNTEILDMSGVPYVVPDLDGYGTTIGDIYPAIDALRETILTIPDADSIASALTGSLEDTIADIIAAIKDLAITVPDVKEGDEPVPNPDPEFPDSIPVGYWPSFIPDLLDLDLFSIFKPVFDIVGEDYSMFSTWMLIPSILLFLIILYLVVSVF